MKLRCPDCRKTFPWAAKEPWPEYCPMCRACIHEPNDEEVICMPFVSSRGLVKSSDELYRKMEAGSERRVEMAAEKLGVEKSEVSELKITNLQDARNPGEVAAVPVNNSVTQVMAQAPTGAFGFSGNNGLGFSGAVGTGAFANSGAKFQSKLREYHGNLTRHTAVGDNPAIEVQQPGYRRRA
jgi:hypothetical protein